MLALVAALTLIATRDPGQLWWIALLAVAGAARPAGPRAPVDRPARAGSPRWWCIGLAASQVAVAAAIGASVGGLGAAAVLPYLAVPVTVTALRRRFREGAALLGVTAATLLVAGGSPRSTAGGSSASRATWRSARSGWSSPGSASTPPARCTR